MAHYDPQFEKDIRLSLMEELLLDNCWSVLDVEQHLDDDWIMVDRDEHEWLQPTNALPFSPTVQMSDNPIGDHLRCYQVLIK